ncbi:hypothetical protein FA15DRAFT_731596 [Coprinopsis marcescibilis]|uniref:Uncharacterized protein n=1 Tax=Coprinopsis marcescibilis TaxID=230819 RepID=A0A5C3KD93_COPMA|nr:hypothetical protein FA15DRAFT_731596 [Coprinopsis marcescibilis]
MATSDSEVLLIYDNSSPRFSFTNVDPLALERSLLPFPGLESLPFSYNQTFLLTRNSTEPGEGGNRTRGFSFEFEGTSVALFGQFFQSVRDRSVPAARWRIDSGEMAEIILRNEMGPGQFFVSPPLSEGRHNLTFEVTEEAQIYLVLDYAVVRGGQRGQYDNDASVVVDDDSPKEIFYWGQWTSRTFGLETLNQAMYLPHQNNTRRTATIGTGFKFKFSGTSIQVYGVKDLARPGAYNITWTLNEGESKEIMYRVSAQEVFDHTSLEFPEYPHWPVVDFLSLESAEHTLTANLTYIEGETQGFILDYLVYQPTFSNLAGKPRYNVSELDPFIKADPPIDPTELAKAKGSGGVNIPVVVGSVVGGVVFVLAVALVAYMLVLRRRRQGTTQRDEVRHVVSEISSNQSPRIDPFDSGTGTFSSPISSSTHTHLKGPRRFSLGLGAANTAPPAYSDIVGMDAGGSSHPDAPYGIRETPSDGSSGRDQHTKNIL